MIPNTFVFDIGNVILDFNPDALLSEHTSELHTIRILKEVLFQSELWQRMDNGEILSEAIYELAKHGLDSSDHHVLKQFLEAWSYSLSVCAAMCVLIGDLKEKSYGVYLCSNAPALFKNLFETYPILKVFDGTLFSAEIQISKPNPLIY